MRTISTSVVLVGTCLILCLKWHADLSTDASACRRAEEALLLREHVPNWQNDANAPNRESRDGPSPPLPPPSASHTGNAFRVASWNLRIPFPRDEVSGNSWLARRPYIARAIYLAKPDILGLQEDCYFMNEDLLAEFSLGNEYERYGLFNRNGEDGMQRPREGRGRAGWPENVFSKDGLRDGEHNSVWWRRDRFELIQNDTFWLSEQPHVPGTSFNETTGRVVNCVLLRDKLGGQMASFNSSPNQPGFSISQPAGLLVRLCSTHFPSDESLARMTSSVLSKEIHGINHNGASGKGRKEGNHIPDVTFVVGDFNLAPTSKTYQSMAGWFTDSRSLSATIPNIAETVLSVRTSPVNISTTPWYQNDEMLIDYIWLLRPDTESDAVCSVVVDALTHLPVLTSIPASLNSNDGDVYSAHELYRWHDVVARSLPFRSASDHMMIIADIRWKSETKISAKL